MNGKRVQPMLRLAAIMLGGLLFCRLANGWSLANVVDDPLFSRPPVLDTGARLPGDAQPVACPVNVDLARPLSLADAVDLGLCNNPQIRVAWTAIKIQAANVGEARSAYLPTAALTLSRLHTTTEYPGHPYAATYANGHTANASVTWRLFDFGARAANREVANRSLDAALASHDATLQKVMSSVVKGYFDAQTAKAMLAARTESTGLAQETFDATVARQRMGVAAQSDVLQAATALAKARLAEQQARADERSSQATLLYALGIDPSKSLQLGEPAYANNQSTVEDLKYWFDAAAERHPAIVAAKAQWEAAQAKVKATRAEGLPTIDLTGNFYQNGYPNQGLQPVRSNVTTVGLTLTIPLFEGFSREYRVSSAQAAAEQSEGQFEDATHQVLTDVIKAHASAVSAATNLQSSEDLMRAAEASFESSRRRYKRGAADILELLSVQSAFADAKTERVRSIANWNSTRLNLAAAAGVLGHHLLESGSP
ncbi:TolC family protein [Burkholderia ubonensis]|uniref:TolC family protein n=1 Tax=Burkholderia ubonensis TaxID=101571 RepID=UPI00358E18C1